MKSSPPAKSAMNSGPPSSRPRHHRAIIMAGGQGTRLAPYTRILPKPLIPVDGKPILEIVLRQLDRHGFRRITICVGPMGELIRAYFGDGGKFGVDIEYTVEDRPLGTVGPLRLLRQFAEAILVINGDILTDLDYGDLLDAHTRDDGALLTIATCARSVDISLGVVDFDESHRVTGFREKPRMSYWACMGAYAMSPGILEFIPPGRAWGLDELVEALLASRQQPRVYPFEGMWLDLARPEDHERATDVFHNHRDRLLP